MKRKEVKSKNENKNNLTTVIILFIVLLMLIVTIPMTLSRYETNANSNVNTSVAYYVLDASYQYLDVKIPDIVPRSEPYIYNFTISNNKSGKRAEVSLEYDLMLKTTTNLELRYELYMNEDYQSGQNTIVTNNVTPDAYGTYFRELTSPKQFFDYRYNETNSYTLLIYFDEIYKDYKYQNVIESIYIIIDSRQTIS